MLQELISWLPQEAGRGWVPGALACAAGGLVRWARGARVGRSALTLAGVAAGAWLGMRVPQWLGSEVDPMGLACCGAMVLGMAGYLLHTLWVGLTLGTLLAGVGVLVAWNTLADGATWSVPLLDWSAPTHQILHALWASLPGALPRGMPLVVTGCFAAGVLGTVLWPRVGGVFAFSSLGAVLFSAGAAIAVGLGRPQWLEYVPAGAAVQGGALAAMVLVGAAVQWCLYPRAAGPVNAAAAAAHYRTAAQPNDFVADAVRRANVGGMKLREARA